MKIVSVNIGKRRVVQWNGKSIETGIFKYPVDSPVFLGTEDVEDDHVIDRRYHGGIDQAVYAYAENHYAFWKKKYPELDWNYGMFGENLTISDLDENELFVGDKFQLGEVVIEVTKPRQPCMKLGIRFGTQSVLKQFWNSTKSGVYFKVLKTGKVQVGDQMELLAKSNSGISIADVYQSKRPK